MAEVYGLISASPLESHAQDKANKFYVDLGVIFKYFIKQEQLQITYFVNS